ncbi:MAG TPA: hypothetical protein VGK59_10865 [Ohtaekwangia sp.]
MKKLLILSLLLITFNSFGQLTTPSGIKYYKFGTGKDVIVYMDGFYKNVTPTPLNTSFNLSFLPSIQSNVTCYIPIPIMNAAWEKLMSSGLMMGTDFLNFVADENPEPKRIFVTGYSAGGDPGYLYGAKRVTAFASVAGSDIQGYHGMMAWRDNGVPVWAFIGTTDTSENSRANCEKTWISWFDPVGDLKLTYVTGGHGSVDDYAYNPANGLWAWFDSIDKPVVSPPPPVPIPQRDTITATYFLPDNDTTYMIGKSGKIYKKH